MREGTGKGRILVVDDHRTIRDSLAQTLADEGYVVAVAEDGETALQQIQARDFDVIFLDVLLPGISGLDVLAEVSKARPETVVVVLTGVEGAKVKDASFRHEAFAYMTKPCEMEDIVAMAERLLGGGDVSQQETVLTPLVE